MGILFKTYNRKQQLHLYKEVWEFGSKHQLDELLGLFTKDEAAKIKVNPKGNKIEIELNGLIVNCKDTRDLKMKFSHLVDLKEKFQKILPVTKKKKK